MSFPLGMPVSRVSATARVDYLKKVLAITAFGLILSGMTGMFTAGALALVPSLLSGFVPMLLILGCWAVTNFVARPMVFGAAKWPGFLLGTVAQGVAMGFLLLVAMLVSTAQFGNPFMFIGVAMAMTGFTGIGIALSFLFVGISGAGLLYQVNEVIHNFDTDQHMEAAYTITIGVLVLFWNLLSLLMRLRR